MSNVYRVTLPNAAAVVHVEAESKNAARQHALKDTVVDRLDSGEVVRLMRDGVRIDTAGAETIDDGQQTLPGVE